MDRLRYRRCFVRELVALVARLHDPSLVVEYLRGKREKKWRKYMYTERKREGERKRDQPFSGIASDVLDFLDLKKKEIFVIHNFFHNSEINCAILINTA